jgi:4-hydroxyphenylpyruvate dioxygenase
MDEVAINVQAAVQVLHEQFVPTPGERAHHLHNRYFATDIMTFQPAIASMSLGRAWHHNLQHKLAEAAKAGFRGIEIFYEDLEYFARDLANIPTDAPPSTTQLITAATRICSICKQHNLEIIGLQPFLFYEGLLDREQHAKLIEKMHLWLDIADALGTSTVQIPSNFLPASQLTGDLDVIVRDLIEVADIGAARRRPIRFAYENLCWGTHVDTWEVAWEVVRRVDRANFGICLDTFNIAGRVWADPSRPDGKVEGDADARLSESLDALVRTVDVSKVFYIQLVDAERLEAPLDQDHPYFGEGQPARMSWSRNARCFMGEEERGAYLPVWEVANAIVHKLGYRGFVSMELFSRTMTDPDPSVPRQHAQRGMASWEKIREGLRLEESNS